MIQPPYPGPSSSSHTGGFVASGGWRTPAPRRRHGTSVWSTPCEAWACKRVASIGCLDPRDRTRCANTVNARAVLVGIGGGGLDAGMGGQATGSRGDQYGAVDYAGGAVEVFGGLPRRSMVGNIGLMNALSYSI